MSNYQENGPYSEGMSVGGQAYPEASQGGPGPSQGGAPMHDTAQYSPVGGQQPWEAQPGYQGQGLQGQGYQGGPGQGQGHPGQGHQGQGHQGQGLFQGGNPLSSSGVRNLRIRSTFKTTEFWVLIVVSLGVLIAAAVTDVGRDGQAFGAHEAWKFVTWLSIAYILSRGLTKFAGHERDDDHRRGRR